MQKTLRSAMALPWKEFRLKIISHRDTKETNAARSDVRTACCVRRCPQAASLRIRTVAEMMTSLVLDRQKTLVQTPNAAVVDKSQAMSPRSEEHTSELQS